MRLVRRILLLALALVVAAAAGYTLVARSQLERARDDVEASWSALAEPLDARYALLGAVTAAIGDTGGPAAALVSDVDDALERWRSARRGNAPVDAQVDAANRLEGLGRRLAATVRASVRLSGRPEVVAALDAYAGAPVPEQAAAYDAAARRYADERSSSARRLVAQVLGYEAVSAFDLAS